MQALLVLFAVGAISTAITCWLLYSIIKTAIRDGINESTLCDTLRYGLAQAKPPAAPPAWETTRPPEIRAER